MSPAQPLPLASSHWPGYVAPCVGHDMICHSAQTLGFSDYCMLGGIRAGNPYLKALKLELGEGLLQVREEKDNSIRAPCHVTRNLDQ